LNHKLYRLMNMKKVSRRGFIGKSLAVGAGALIAPGLLKMQSAAAAIRSEWIGKNDISLAQWALVGEVQSGKWKTVDFARIAREDFGLNGIEFVNTLFEVPTLGYLNRLKKNAADHGVTMVLIMVDGEG
jgi:L-ribulose-5-phosphate 3-epimerase